MFEVNNASVYFLVGFSCGITTCLGELSLQSFSNDILLQCLCIPKRSRTYSNRRQYSWLVLESPVLPPSPLLKTNAVQLPTCCVQLAVAARWTDFALFLTTNFYLHSVTGYAVLAVGRESVFTFSSSFDGLTVVKGERGELNSYFAWKAFTVRFLHAGYELDLVGNTLSIFLTGSERFDFKKFRRR